MNPGWTFPADQAEIVFSDNFVEYLSELTVTERESVLVDVIALCSNPIGTHRLGNKDRWKLAGWNTLYVLGGHHRIVFACKISDDVGVIEVLCGGPRRGDAVYDLAADLTKSGRLTDDEVTEIWLALALLETVAERVGQDGWDYAPAPAPEGMQRAAVASGLLEPDVAQVLSLRELQAAMSQGWGPDGRPDKVAALTAALQEARFGINPGDVTRILTARLDARCGALLPVAQRSCIRRLGHPGPHRSRY